MRDRLAAEKDVLCFEMEAAGLMNHFPCLVIRGICDYSDSHKNKEWQGYAAMTAAAYAKDVLTRIPPNKIEAEKRISDILSEHREIAREQRDIAKEQRDIATKHLQVQRDFAKERLSEKEEKCHQLFRLTTDGNGATYEWYKDHSGLLLVSADPGCGKSVLAKYLVDHGLPQSATICYFFFKDQDQNTVRQALCALLHQLFSQKPHLIGHAMTEFRKDGHALINSTESLWKVLRNTTEDPQAGPIIIVLDALDECAESEFADLMRNMENQSHSEHSRLRYLLTCRPYEQIISKFRSLLNAFPNIRIPGEEESEAISQEVNHVIKHRIRQLSEQKGLSTQVINYLENYLQEAPHRTYLWVYLIFDYLEKEDFKKTLKGVESSITQLPRNINDAYEQILCRSKEDPMVRKALSIILAASRPLSLSEMNIAININNTSQSINDLDLEDEKDFELRLRSWCGLFISIYHDKIYFLHQTAREFLLAPTTIPSKIGWRHSIAAHHAHAVLAELCVLYLNFFNSNISLPTGTDRENRHSVNSNTFLDYSAKAWGAHFRQASIIDNAAIICSALRICDPDSKSYSVWSGIYWQSIGVNTPKYFTGLMVASHYGHRGVVKLLLEKGANVNAQDGGGWTPLSWAADGGHEAVVKLLLKKGAKVDAQDRYGQTPLRQAADGRHEAVIKLLLEKGANVNAQDSGGRTPLSQAIATAVRRRYGRPLRGGHEAVVKLLLEEGANINAQDRYGQTLLSQAANRGYKAIVKLLLEKGAKVDAQDRYGQTPLQQAADGGHEAVVKLLLEKGGKVDAQDRYGQTPLWQAVAGGHEAVVKLLLEEGANINAQDRYGQTLLLQAANRGHKAVVKLLLEKGANINAQDRYGQTPLSQAADRGHKAVVKLLLKMGANYKNR
ncbi:hypothetical protein TrVGV298_003681 [Trichoderma virens]|nr:hypothetical protein TrVGV298_003681 [Trichoderma virens]